MSDALLKAHLNGPIPGESLTKEPGAMPWEKPPQIVNVDDAMDDIMARTLRKGKAVRYLALMENGMPVEGITRLVVFEGFFSGRWTIDLAVLLFKPVMAFFMAMAKRAGIKPRIRISGDDPGIMDERVLKAFVKDAPKDTKEASAAAKGAAEDVRSKGLMSRGVRT